MTTLSVERFGQGTVLDASGKVICATSVCTVTYAEGDTIALDAQPAPGWRLHGWMGCDDTTGNSCTISLDDARTIYPTFERIAPPTLHHNVFELDDADVNNIVSIQEGAIVFSGAATKMEQIPVGSVLVSKVGEGFARKVDQVLVLQGSSITMATSEAPTEDVIREGTIIFNRPLLNSDLAQVGVVNGVRYMPRSVASPIFKFAVEVELEKGVKLKGTLELEVTPDFALDFNWTGLQEFKSVVEIRVRPELEIMTPKNFKWEDEVDIPMPPMTFPISVGPLILTMEVNGRAKISIDGNVAITGSIETSGRAGMHYVQFGGWHGIGEAHLSGNFPPLDLQGDLKATVMVGPMFSTKIYGVLGPQVFVGPYYKATGAVHVLEQCIKSTQWIGGKANSKIEGKILGWKVSSANLTVFDVGWEIDSRKVGNCADHEAPSRPDPPIIDGALPTSVSLHWMPSTDNRMVRSYEVYRNHILIATTGDLSYVDTSLTPKTGYCYYLDAIDTDGNRSPASSSTCTTTSPLRDDEPPTIPSGVSARAISSSSIVVSWNPSTDDSGAVSYLVYVTNDSRVRGRFEDVGATISKLQPASQYCFRLVAVDRAGNMSGLSNQACATTNSVGTYRVMIKCTGSPYYAVDTTMDLDEEVSTSISVVGAANDYDGTPMTYVLTGDYDPSSKSMEARIDWDFEGNSCHRIDTFEIDMRSSDTSDVAMNQVAFCGCDAQIRFIRGDVPRASQESHARHLRESFVEGMPTLSHP